MLLKTAHLKVTITKSFWIHILTMMLTDNITVITTGQGLITEQLSELAKRASVRVMLVQGVTSRAKQAL